MTRTGAPVDTSSGCIWHETHWHCNEAGHDEGHAEDDHDHADQADSGHDHADHASDHGHNHTSSESASSDQCVIHGKPETHRPAHQSLNPPTPPVGHTHGNCSASDLACGAVLLEDYNLPLHIGAIFVILVTSALGVMIPLVAGRHTSSSLDASTFGRGVGFWGNVFFLARHFGTGIILSTAFVHLLYHGFVMFANDCVGELVYEATAPALALAAAMATFLLDFVGSRAVHKSSNDDAQTPAHRPHSPQSGDEPKTGADIPVIATEVCSHAEAALRSEQGWQVVLLEAGIIFHSIMIGVTLGAGSGAGWTTLLIVLVFHQFFEGAALGARIALLYWISRLRAFAMGAAFMVRFLHHKGILPTDSPARHPHRGRNRHWCTSLVCSERQGRAAVCRRVEFYLCGHPRECVRCDPSLTSSCTPRSSSSQLISSTDPSGLPKSRASLPRLALFSQGSSP